jgi:urease accessory protein
MPTNRITIITTMSTTMSIDSSPALLHLLHLVSPALPVGAYAYSQGLESAVDQSLVSDLNSAEQWLHGCLTVNVGHLDAPVFLRLYQGWHSDNQEQIDYWNNYLQASRETAELLLEDTQMGEALLRLLKNLGLAQAQTWAGRQSVSYATGFALAAQHWNIDPRLALRGLLWAWLENQVAAAIKLIPLGQTQGQELLVRLIPVIESTVQQAASITDDNIGWSLPRLSMISIAHEHQYSRLFRS